MHPSGKNHWNWKGGISHHSAGYILVKCPKHPSTNIHGYVYQHRLVMEKHLGRYLKFSEQIHHINGDKADNRIENLILFKNAADHTCNEKNKVFIRQCKICGKNFLATRGRLICSKCRIGTCKICGKKFPINIRKRKTNSNIYCSLECRNEANKIRLKANNYYLDKR